MQFKRLFLTLIVLFSFLPLGSTQARQPIVKLIYFIPREFPPNRRPIENVEARMDELIKDVQQFYAVHMENHGFAPKTFQFETDARGRAVVNRVKGKFNAPYYNGAGGAHTRVRDEIGRQFDTSQDFYYLVVIDPSITFAPTGIGTIATTFLDDTGFDVELAAHELGHVFGLTHDYSRSDGTWVTSLRISDPMTTSFCAAEWLDVHPAFNPNPISVDAGHPKVKMLPPSLAAPPNAIRLRFEVTDPDGLHQVQLIKHNPRAYHDGLQVLMDCQKLNGSRNKTIDFITTGLFPKDTVFLSIIDNHGNITFTQLFPIDITDLLPSAEIVSITDRNLAVSVRNTLGLEPDDVLTTKMMLGLTSLRVADVVVKDLTGLEQASNLAQLILWNTSISNISALSKMTKMTRLSLIDNSISDVSALTGLKNLRFMSLSGNSISDISALAGLTNLTELNLRHNSISDVSPLAGLTNLGYLSLKDNSISDVSPLTGLTNLTQLHLEDNSISDVSPLIRLTHLKLLPLQNNPLSDISLQKHIPAIKANGTTVFYDKRQIAPRPQTPVVQVRAAHRPPMYWINSEAGTLHRLVGDKVENLASEVRNATGLAIDVPRGRLYWTEKTSNRTGRIRRANLDGRNVQLVKNLTSVPHGIALDTAGGKIYLTNSWGKIQRLNVNGSNFQPNLITGLDTPRGLTLDVSGGKVYWTEMSGRIRRANLDGSNVQDVATNLGTPMNLVVFDGSLYWTEKTGENSGEIRFLALESNSGDTKFNNTFTEGFPVGIGLDAVENKLYWTTSNGKIGRVSLDSGDFQSDIVTGLGVPSAFAVAVEIPVVVETKEISATDAVLSISPSPVISPAVGERLTLNLNIVDGETVAGYQVTLQFDASALRYVGSSDGSYLPAGASFVPPVIKTNHVELASTALTGVSNGDGTLATVTFEVLAAKASTLTLSEPLLTDNQGNTSRPQVEKAEVTEPPKLKADVTGDGVVSILDLVYVSSNFGETGQNRADVNDDGVVNIVDLVLVAGDFGRGAGAPSLDPSFLEGLITADVHEWLSQAHQLNNVSPTHQRGIWVLEQLLAALTPKETLLLPNYPNPFNPETWIPYQLAEPAEVTLHIYAVDGKLIRTLALGHQPVGIYHSKDRAVYWDGRNQVGEPVASGVYFYTFRTDDFTATKKMLILK